jgi:hypothetical protein
MDADELPRCRGGVRRMSLPEGQRFAVTGLSLVTGPASATAALPPLVHVWAEVGVGHGARAIGKLSLENPIAPVRPPVELGDGEFVLRHDSASSTVRLYRCFVDTLRVRSLGEKWAKSYCSNFRCYLTKFVQTN